MMAREGASVAFTGRSRDVGEALQQRLRDSGATVTYVQADSRDENSVADAVATTVKAHGPLTVLVNSATATDVAVSGVDSHVDEITNEDWDYVVRTALYGTLWASKYAIPHMRTASGGSIVNISASSSIRFLRSLRSRPAYQASKAAINALTRQMAVDYGGENMRCNAIIVGFINSGGEVMQRLLADEAYMQVIRGMLVLPRIGEPADIAAAAVFLASDESKYVTGSQITEDGGATSCQPVMPRVVASG
jgi:NAD(P)-dependent dehydrogenase (short-subunit alcohol dehydrogenase family)